MLKTRPGDTLIEVLFAVAIFSAVAIGAIVIMNQGINSAQTALEINLVRNQIDTQSQLLHQMNDAKLTSLGRGGSIFAQTWDRIIDGDDSSPSLVTIAAQDYDAISTYEDCTYDNLSGNPFFIDPASGDVITGSSNFEQPVTFSQIRLSPTPGVVSTSDMIWVEVVDSSNESSGALTNTRSYDFHIRACWQSPGSGDLMKIGTIVRLYAPAE